MTDEDKKPLLAAFKRFLDIQRGVQSRLQAFIQNFETEMHTFFQDYLLPLAGKKISGLKFSKFDRPAPLLPAKRGRPEKEKPDFSRYESNGPSLRKSLRKKSDSQLYAHMELIKNRVRDLYSKSVNPALIAKLYNLNLELVHSLGDWRQVPDDVSERMREIKFDCLKLSENGATLKEIGKHMRIPKKKVLFLLGELTPSDLLKSSESKKVIVNKVNEGVSKVALAQELGLPCYKLQHWINEASAGRELSDDDAIHSDSENSRDTIRNAIFYYYQSNSKEAASSITKTEPNRIARWVNRFENDVDTSITIEPPPQKPQKKTLPSDVIDKNNSLIADFIKKSVS